jgi:hypothetical protein
MNRAPDSSVSAASANVPGHSTVDIGVARISVRSEKGGGRHQLSGLTVTALRHIAFGPDLNQCGMLVSKIFDGGNRFAIDALERGLARSSGHAVYVYRAGSTKAGPASEFCAGKV